MCYLPNIGKQIPEIFCDVDERVYKCFKYNISYTLYPAGYSTAHVKYIVTDPYKNKTYNILIIHRLGEYPVSCRLFYCTCEVHSHSDPYKNKTYNILIIHRLGGKWFTVYNIEESTENCPPSVISSHANQQ